MCSTIIFFPHLLHLGLCRLTCILHVMLSLLASCYHLTCPTLILDLALFNSFLHFMVWKMKIHMCMLGHSRKQLLHFMIKLQPLILSN
ncbi:hypothetical protein RchiOBHm_Chr1g0344631 [Rosa chinensis]|uniref:Uncharacterized protein n=1 Tax=Rosa chinensis TaxID=74649 RepID=A0A2P6SEL2_ROSCH|nr:hypothetical protein RchiOBHm_Chr1g0344631 [Rosa chinensis]